MIVGLLLGCGLLASCSADIEKKDAPTTRAEAGAVVLNELLYHEPGEDLLPVRVRREPLARGEEIVQDGDTGWRHHYCVPYESWFFFINDEPHAAYTHWRRFVFVDTQNPYHYEVFSGLGFWPVGVAEMDTLDMQLYEYRSYEDGGRNDWVCRTPPPR